jgi:hypothetical protein
LARIRARLTNWNGSTIDAGRTYVTAAAHNGTFAAVRWGRSYQTAASPRLAAGTVAQSHGSALSHAPHPLDSGAKRR